MVPPFSRTSCFGFQARKILETHFLVCFNRTFIGLVNIKETVNWERLGNTLKNNAFYISTRRGVPKAGIWAHVLPIFRSNVRVWHASWVPGRLQCEDSEPCCIQGYTLTFRALAYHLLLCLYHLETSHSLSEAWFPGTLLSTPKRWNDHCRMTTVSYTLKHSSVSLPVTEEKAAKQWGRVIAAKECLRSWGPHLDLPNSEVHGSLPSLALL